MECPDCPDLCANSTTPAAKVSPLRLHLPNLALQAECVELYSHKYYQSAAMDYNFFCKPGWKDFRPAFAQYTGVLIGNIILGYVADRIGRRKTLVFLNLFFTFDFGFLLSMAIGIPALVSSGIFTPFPREHAPIQL